MGNWIEKDISRTRGTPTRDIERHTRIYLVTGEKPDTAYENADPQAPCSVSRLRLRTLLALAT